MGSETKRGNISIFWTDAAGVRVDDVESSVLEVQENISDFRIDFKPMLTSVGLRYACIEIDGKSVGNPIPIEIQSAVASVAPPKLVGDRWVHSTMVSGVAYSFTLSHVAQHISDAGVSFLDLNGNLVQIAKHTIDWSEAADGKIKVTVVPNVPGNWSLFPTVNGEPTVGAPYPVTVQPSRNIKEVAPPLKVGIANASASLAPRSCGVIGTPVTFQIMPHDVNLGPLEVTFKSESGPVLFDTEVRHSHQCNKNYKPLSDNM